MTIKKANMGLDGVELIIKVEDNFQVELADEELIKVVTVGDLYKLVLSKMNIDKIDTCLTSHTFYKLRKTMIDKFGIDRKSIKPMTKLDDIFPDKEARKEKWKEYGKLLNLEIPDLEKPEFVTFIMVLCLVTSIATGLILGLVGIVPVYFAWLIVLSFIPVIYIINKMTDSMVYCFDKKYDTMGNLTKIVVQKNFIQLSEGIKKWNEKDVWDSLIFIIVDVFDIPPEKIIKESSIVKDLGID